MLVMAKATMKQLTCPFCGYTGPRRRFGYFAVPEPRDQYATPLCCPKCSMWWAPIDKQPNSGYTEPN